jgi:hypothetical protein
MPSLCAIGDSSQSALRFQIFHRCPRLELPISRILSQNGIRGANAIEQRVALASRRLSGERLALRPELLYT